MRTVRSGLARSLFLGIAAFLLTGLASAAPAGKPLEIYFVDVEGGQATLFVTPEGHSLLIDTGWPGNSGRDADRIVAAATKAGLSKIDFVLLTHYHMDHAGGVPQLRREFPLARSSITARTVSRAKGNGAELGRTTRSVASKGIKRIIAKVGRHLAYRGNSCGDCEF